MTARTAPRIAATTVDREGAAPRMHPAFATAAVIAAMAAVNIAEHWIDGGLWLGPAVAVALVAFARRGGLTWSQLGLGTDRLRSGLRWGLGAISVVATIYVAGILLPVSRTAFLDVRYRLELSAALRSAFVVIPLGTVLLEEIAFRSVLWGMLARHLTKWRVLAASSMLFGLWHVLPSLHLASANRAVGNVAGGTGAAATALVVAATVAFTAVGGVIAGELRRRSGSVLASVGMHWATNALGVLFGLLAWHLAA